MNDINKYVTLIPICLDEFFTLFSTIVVLLCWLMLQLQSNLNRRNSIMDILPIFNLTTRGIACVLQIIYLFLLLILFVYIREIQLKYTVV